MSRARGVHPDQIGRHIMPDSPAEDLSLSYRHVEPPVVKTISVRYRQAGKLAPRKIVVSDGC